MWGKYWLWLISCMVLESLHNFGIGFEIDRTTAMVIILRYSRVLESAIVGAV